MRLSQSSKCLPRRTLPAVSTKLHQTVDLKAGHTSGENVSKLV